MSVTADPAALGPAVDVLDGAAVLLADRHGRVLRANGRATALFAVHAPLEGRHLTGLLVGDDPGVLEPDLDRLARDGGVLRRTMTAEHGASVHRYDIRVALLTPERAGARFCVLVHDRGDVLENPVIRRLLADLAGDDPLRVTLLLDRALRCVDVIGAGAARFGIDVDALRGHHVCDGIPEPLRVPIIERYSEALAGRPSEFEIVVPTGGRRYLLDVRPLRCGHAVDGVVVQCRRIDGPQGNPVVAARDLSGSRTATVLRAGRVALDLVTRHAHVDGRTSVVRLTDRECELLADLMRHQNTLRSRAQLLSAVWDIDFATSTAVVDVTLHRLRVKLDLAELRTVRGNGLAFVSDLDA